MARGAGAEEVAWNRVGSAHHHHHYSTGAVEVIVVVVVVVVVRSTKYLSTIIATCILLWPERAWATKFYVQMSSDGAMGCRLLFGNGARW